MHDSDEAGYRCRALMQLIAAIRVFYRAWFG